ncbi:MAG: PQQ-like beta-propeller repeat protein [Polyangiaceae bacterium]|nr:PQQ-like beta-propeller repeat protein [Polyangiaceae bacterium]
MLLGPPTDLLRPPDLWAEAVIIFFAPTALGVAGWIVGKRQLLEIRRPSVLASALDRQRIFRALLVIFVWAATLAVAGGQTLAAPVFAALAILAVGLFVLDGHAVRQLVTWRAWARPEEELLRVASAPLDLGTGDDVRVIGQDGAHPYRDLARPKDARSPRRLLGDLEAVSARVRRRLAPDAAFGAVCVIASCVAFLYPTPLPFGFPWGDGLRFAMPSGPTWVEGRAPILVDVDKDGVEDIIGVHQVFGFGGGDDYDNYAVAVTSGATFKTLWATKRGPVVPEVCASKSGVFVSTSPVQDTGELISFDGDVSPAKRPSTCGPSGRACTESGPCAHDGHVYARLSGRSDIVEKRVAKTGELVWETTLPDAPKDRSSRAALFTVSASRVYVGTGKRVEVLDIESGELLGTVR